MTAVDLAMLEAVYAMLPPDGAAMLADLLAPPWQRAAARRDRRDGAIRGLGNLLPDMRPTRKAETIAADLARYHASGWQHERHGEPPGTDPRRTLWHRVLTYDGEPLRWRQVFNILNGSRGAQSM